MTLARKVCVAVLVELSYAVLTRLWLPTQAEGIALELYVTAIRGVTAAIYWWLFRDVIGSRQPRWERAARPPVVVGLLLVMLIPVLVGNSALPDPLTKLVFAATSFVVGLREEWLYRGVVQNLLEKRVGWAWAIVLSNILFTVYHYGALPFTLPNVVEFFTIGSVLGLLYVGTGSLRLAIVVHALYDALWSLTPLLVPPFSPVVGIVMQLAACVLFAAWAWRAQRPLS